MLGLRYSANPGCLAAFVRRVSETLELALVQRYPLLCEFHSLDCPPLRPNARSTDPWNLARISPSNSLGTAVRHW
jgi:hypothetical protein